MAEGKGPARRRGRQPRPVICLETGEEYESVITAAAAIGKAYPTVKQAIRTGGLAGGYHWTYSDDPNLAMKLGRYAGGNRGHRLDRKVICLETGEEFESAADAAAAASVSGGNICCAIRSGGRACGFHWAFADDQDIAEKLARYFGGDHAHRRGGKVICIETGEEYESVAAAVTETSVPLNTIYSAIRRGCRAGGYHWAYADDPELADKLERFFGGVVREGRGRPKRPVICLETGEEYESASAAAIGTIHSTVYQAIRTGGRSGGYHWAYADDQDIAAKLERYFGGESRVQAVTSIKSAPYTVTGAVSGLTQNTVDGSLRGKQADECLMQDSSIKAAHAARDKRQKVPARVGLRDQGIKQ